MDVDGAVVVEVATLWCEVDLMTSEEVSFTLIRVVLAVAVGVVLFAS